MVFEPSPSKCQLVRQFVDALREIPGVHADVGYRESTSHGIDCGHDAEVDLRVADKSFVSHIETRKTVFPRDARQMIWKFREASHGQNNEPLLLLVADSISPGAKELLRNEHVGYYDSGGSLYLPTPGAYIYIDKPPPKSLTKPVRSLFSGRRTQVLHTLLVHHQNWFGVTGLAQQAMVSPATVSQVLTELEYFDWLVSRGQGPGKERHLSDPTTLLDAWAGQLASMRSSASLRRYYVPATKPETLLKRVGAAFDAHDAKYAISHEAAAQYYTPFLSNVSQVRVRLLSGVHADDAIGDLGARVVSDGANLAIIEVKSPGGLLFRERIGDLWLANSIQIYLDLLCGEGRSKEMAEHFRKERIGF